MRLTGMYKVNGKCARISWGYAAALIVADSVDEAFARYTNMGGSDVRSVERYGDIYIPEDRNGQ